MPRDEPMFFGVGADASFHTNPKVTGIAYLRQAGATIVNI